MYGNLCHNIIWVIDKLLIFIEFQIDTAIYEIDVLNSLDISKAECSTLEHFDNFLENDSKVWKIQRWNVDLINDSSVNLCN